MKKLLSILLTSAMLLSFGAVYAETEKEVIDIGTAIEDSESWTAKDADALTIEEGILTTTSELVSYEGEKFGDGTYTFAAKIDGEFELMEESSEVSWLGIAIKHKQPLATSWGGNEICYLVVVKPDVIELQKWVGGMTVFLETFENKLVKGGQWHNYELTTVKEDDGMRCVLNVDGENAFDYMDYSDPVLSVKGIFTIYNYTRPLPVTPIQLKAFEGEITDIGTTTATTEPTATPAPTETPTPNEEPAATPVPTAPSYQVYPADDVTILVNGKELVTDVAPVFVNDRVLVPMRAIFEAMGAEVTWDDATKTVEAKKRMFGVKLTIGDNFAYLNGAPQTLDATPIVRNDRTLVPVRVCAEGLNANVDWNGDTRTVIITDK